MVSMGVIPEVAERCLNHTEENRVKRTYQRHSYETEMKIAWQHLGAKLAEITSSNVQKRTVSDDKKEHTLIKPVTRRAYR